MRAGSLNESITIEQPIKHENELGEVVDNLYAKKFCTRAQVIYKSGARVEDYTIQTDYTVQFVVRIYHQISETDRVLYRNQRYRIDSIEISREYQMQKLNCTLLHE